MSTPLPTRSQWPSLGMGLQNSGFSSRKGSPGAWREKIWLSGQLNTCWRGNFWQDACWPTSTMPWLFTEKNHYLNTRGAFNLWPYEFFPRKIFKSRSVRWDAFQRSPRHAGARLYWLRDWDQQLSHIVPPGHCRQEFYQVTGQQATRPIRVLNPYQVAVANSGSKFWTNWWNIVWLLRLLWTSGGHTWRHSCRQQV